MTMILALTLPLTQPYVRGRNRGTTHTFNPHVVWVMVIAM